MTPARCSTAMIRSPVTRFGHRTHPQVDASHTDPLRMYLVLRRGAIETIARAGELAGAAAVACLRAFGDDPERGEAIAQWRERPGKTVAQVAHAAVMAGDGGALEDWVRAGCPGRVLAPGAQAFDALAARADCVARVVDAGLTEVPPGTITVIALAPGPAGALPAGLRDMWLQRRHEVGQERRRV